MSNKTYMVNATGDGAIEFAGPPPAVRDALIAVMVAERWHGASKEEFNAAVRKADEMDGSTLQHDSAATDAELQKGYYE